MRVAVPRLSEILAVQGVPAETWIRDSVLRRSARPPPPTAGSALPRDAPG